MVLVDTSVWVDHLYGAEPGLKPVLEHGEVCCHPLVLGELACGGIKNREEILSLLADLPSILEAEHDEVLSFLEHHRLWGKGLGFIDVSLLASCMLSTTPLWTKDKNLRGLAKQFGINYT